MIETPSLTPEKNALYRKGLRVLDRVARSYWRRYGGRIELDELVSAGLPALTRAVRRYDPQRGRFGPYLAQRLRWSLLAEVRKRVRQRLDPDRGRPIGASETFSLGYVRVTDRENRDHQRLDSVFEFRGDATGRVTVAGDLADTAVAVDIDPEHAALRDDLARAIRAALAKLTPREQALIRRHYFGGQMLQEIARALELSVSTVSRIHRDAVIALAEHLREAGIVEEG